LLCGDFLVKYNKKNLKGQDFAKSLDRFVETVKIVEEEM